MTEQIHQRINGLSDNVTQLATVINSLSVNVEKQTALMEGHKDLVHAHLEGIRRENKNLHEKVIKNERDLDKQTIKINGLETSRDRIIGGLKTAQVFWGIAWSIGMVAVGGVVYVVGG